MSYISLAKYTLKDDPEIGQSWQLPASVTASVDLTPPALDGVIDDNPLTNHAICLSDEPLDSNDLHYSLGTGNVSEMMMSGTDRDAWESIAGYRPQADTIADCIAEHLLRSPGQERVNPLTCGFNRGLEVHLGGRIWDHTLTWLTDTLALPVLQIEAEGLATIFREQGEMPYRLAMGGTSKKYKLTRPVKELIQFIFPAGRDDLPLLDELAPQTVITETWAGGVADNSWTNGNSSTWTVGTGTVSCTANPAGTAWRVLNHAFPNSDRYASFVVKNTTAGRGIISRSNSGFTAFYFGYIYRSLGVEIKKRVSGSNTQIYISGTTFAIDDTLQLRSVGSTQQLYKNGADISAGGITDTAVASGTYSGLLAGGAGGLWGQCEFDDLISGGGFQAYWARRQSQFIGGGLM